MGHHVSYALGKYAEAVLVLATRPGNVRIRVREAYQYLARVSPGIVPDVMDLRQDIRWVLSNYHNGPDGVMKSPYRFAKCSELAMRIVTAHAKLQQVVD